jgi:glycosyltransferase involved in cell wall biosynthesis
MGVKRAYKGYDRLLQSSSHVWRTHPETRFVFVGSRTEHSEALFAQVRDPRIIELGHVDLETKNGALAACDIFCLPSLSESFGIVFLEAWHVGKPVISADIPSSVELVGGSGGGLAVPQSVEAIGEAIVTLLNDPQQRAQMAANGRQVAQQYTIERIGERVQQVYDRLLNGAVPNG